MSKIEELTLLPRPRNITPRTGAFQLSAEKRIICQGDPAAVVPVAEQLQKALWESQRIKWHLWAGSAENDPAVAAIINVNSEMDIPAEGYRLSIGPERIEISAAQPAGAFYAVMTLKQILRQVTGSLPACEINDHPDFAARGIMLDVSRDKVPTLQTLFDLVDQLAELKINHFELYFEHAFAYRNHRDVWDYCPPAPGRINIGTVSGMPITGEDILRLDAHCRQRFIDLVPNQNSFGHLARWLDLPRYNGLAECPNGFDWPHGWGHAEFPFSLDPKNPKSLALIEELYDDLLPHFTSRKFNVGCDETHDLGLGKSKAECQRKGKERVYLEFLLKIYELVKHRGRIMHFWGDGICEHPELLPELPSDMVILEWGYDIDYPYDTRCGRYAQAGQPFYVCPSTSTYGSVAGRHYKCLNSVRNAAVNGLKHGAAGFLNTDWGNCAISYLPTSYLDYAAGAAASWCHETYREDDLVPSVDLHIFRDSAAMMGKIAYELGNVYLHFDKSETPFLSLICTAPTEPLPENVNKKTLAAAEEDIQAAIGRLGQAHLNRPDAELVQAGFANTARMLLFACRRGLAVVDGTINSEQMRSTLAANLRTILSEHRRVWMARNRLSGLDDSCHPLEDQLRRLTS